MRRCCGAFAIAAFAQKIPVLRQKDRFSTRFFAEGHILEHKWKERDIKEVSLPRFLAAVRMMRWYHTIRLKKTGQTTSLLMLMISPRD